VDSFNSTLASKLIKLTGTCLVFLGICATAIAQQPRAQLARKPDLGSMSLEVARSRTESSD